MTDQVFPPVDGRCPCCGRDVRPSAVICEVCCLRVGEGEDAAPAQTQLLRQAWEREHVHRTAQWNGWLRAPVGPPPGIVGPPEMERWEASSPGTIGAYHPLEKLMRATLVGFGVLALLTFGSILSETIELRAIQDRGLAAYEDDLGLITAIAPGALWLIAYIYTVAVFIAWLHRAYRNVDAFNPGGRDFGTGWAIGAWFVPFLNLARPYRITKEAWWAVARPDQRSNGPAWMKWWWGTLLVTNWIGWQATRNYAQANQVPEIEEALGVLIFSSVLDLVPLALAVVVVLKISRATEQRFVSGGLAFGNPAVGTAQPAQPASTAWERPGAG